MCSASKFLSAEDVQRVNDAVAGAGERSSARIVPVVASSSGRYEQAEDLAGLWAAALGLALVLFLVTTTDTGQPAPTSDAHWAKELGIVLIVVIGGFLAGALLATHIHLLRRLFVPKRKMRQAASRQARQVFRDCQMRFGRSEQDPPLVVIFVSLFERFATVLADESLQQQLTDAAVEPIRAVILDGLARRRLREGLCQAVSLAAELVAPICPPNDKANDARRHEVALRIMD